MTLHPRRDRVQTGVRMERRWSRCSRQLPSCATLPLASCWKSWSSRCLFAGRLPFDDAGLAQVRELLAIYGVAPAAPAAPAPEE